MSEIKERLEREWRYIAESPRPIFGGFHDRVIQLAKDSLKFLASVPSVAQQPQPRLTPPWDTFKGPTCRGSYLLGSACGNCDRCKWELAQCEYKPASAPVQEEKCPTCTSANKEDRYWRYAKGDHPYSKWHWKNGECEDEPPCETCTDLWHSSGISEVSQPSADPCNHEVGRTITCRLGTLGCSIHEPLPPDTNRASVEQKVAEPTRAANDPVIMVAVEASRKAFDEGRTLTVDQAFPKQAKVAEPTPKRSPAEVFFSEHSCYESRIEALAYEFEDSERDKIFAFADYFAAEQTASLRSQLKSTCEQLVTQHNLKEEAIEKLEVAESALRSRESVIDYEALANEIVAHALDHTKSTRNVIGEISVRLKNLTEQVLRSHDQKLRGRESVAIDYDTEIATFNFIVSATDTDHGYDIDKAKAAVWLRKFSQKLRVQSVEKGLVDALGGLLSVLAEPMPGNLQEYTFAYDRALTSYRQATQPHGLNSGGTEQQ